jgi:hypothetical protein
MTYSDFTLDTVLETFQVVLDQESLFPHVQPIEVPTLLQEVLDEGMSLAYVSEKARSELIVMPILLAVRKLFHRAFSIYSGQRLDVEAGSGLTGECDFILSVSPPLPVVQSPIVVLVEAKKQDIEAGLGQCAAQMVGAWRFNQKKGNAVTAIYGCVTTGEHWQFLRLEQERLTIDRDRYYINEVGTILGVFRTLLLRYLRHAVPVTSDE